MKPLVQNLEVETDYGQIYIYDPQTQLPDEGASEDDDPLQRAMDDAYESRRFVGYANGLIDVVTPSQYNWKAPMRIEVSDEPPPLDLDEWDHVVEMTLPVPSGTLHFEAFWRRCARGDWHSVGPVSRSTIRTRLSRWCRRDRRA